MGATFDLSRVTQLSVVKVRKEDWRYSTADNENRSVPVRRTTQTINYINV